MTTKAETKIRRALDRTIDEFPFFAALAARWTIREARKGEPVETFATNGPELVFSRAFADELTNEEVAWVILHELGHLFLGHHVRLADIDADPKTKNVGADLALNSIIRGRTPERMLRFACFPGRGTFEGMPDGKDMEFYVSALRRNEGQDERDGGEDEPEQGGSDEETGETGKAAQNESSSDSASENSESASEGSESQAESSESGSEGSESGSEGSGTPAKSLDELGTGEIGEVLPAPEPAEGEKSEEQRWTEAVADGVNAARAAGRLPGWISEAAGKILSSKRTISWKELLRRFMQDVSKNQLTFARPNRRSAWRSDVVLPSRFSRDSGKGAILVDTSGSMSLEGMNIAIEEIEKILSTFADAKVTLFQADTRMIDEAERTFSKTDFPIRIPVEWRGRGGTDMNPPLRKIALRRSEFSWLVVLTDGYWDMAGAVDAGIPTLYVITPNGSTSSKPRFGKLLPIE